MQSPQFTPPADRQTFGTLPGALTLLDLPAIYRDFCRELPPEAIQRTKSSQTRKGYDTDGYGYQFCIDLLNDVAGLGHWRIDASESFCEEGEYNSGRKAFEVGYDVTIQLGNWTPAGFEVLAETPRTPGGHVSTMKNDARKGALTNATKKALAFFGIGAAAYRGDLDDDNLPPDGRQDNSQGYIRQTPPQQGRQQAPPSQTPPQQGRQQAPPQGQGQGQGRATDRQIGLLKGSIDRAAQAAGRQDLTHKDTSFLAAFISGGGLNVSTFDELSKAEASYLIDNAGELALQAIDYLDASNRQSLPPSWPQEPPTDQAGPGLQQPYTPPANQAPQQGPRPGQAPTGRRRFF